LKGFQTPETVQGVRAVADVSGNPENIGNKAVAPFNVCDAKPLQSIPQKAELRRMERISKKKTKNKAKTTSKI
ncbi:hypothetical protein Tco_0227206, partial [Tanacetum coccineum]